MPFVETHPKFVELRGFPLRHTRLNTKSLKASGLAFRLLDVRGKTENIGFIATKVPKVPQNFAES